MFKVVATLGILAAAAAISAYTNSKWNFQETSSGRAVRSLTLSFTDKPAKTCMAGDWKEAKIISDPTHYTKSPAYTVRGKTVEILLIGDLCDSYDSYIFDNGLGQPGDHVKYGISRSLRVGKVSASPK